MVRSGPVERIRAQSPPRWSRDGVRPIRAVFRFSRAVWIAALVCLLPFVPSSAQEDAAPAPRAWYAQALARGQVGLNVTYLWSLGPKFRAETVIAGHKIITIVNGATYYVYDGLSMTGVAIGRSATAIAGDSAGRRPFGNEAETLISQGAEKIREEVLLGTQSDVYQVSDRAGRRVLWVTQDSYQLPLRIEIYDRASGKTKHTDFLDWVSGDIPITDAFFEPEAPVKLTRYELEEYLELTANGPVAIPILYAELLHGRKPMAPKAPASSGGGGPEGR